MTEGAGAIFKVPVPDAPDDVGIATMTKVDARIIPLLLAAYVVNFLDRVNVGFAALRMNDDLGFGPAVFGLGAGIFFIGYFLFEVPSNLVLARVGPRRWIARIMITWGLVSAATAFVTTPATFYAARFALGVAEAGFVPALLVYISAWYPPERRAAAVGTIWSATAIALVVGGPVSAAIFRLDGTAGLAGWQWMFLIEAAPALLLGVLVLRRLTDAPAQASWLTGPEKVWLADRLATDVADRRARGARDTVVAALLEPRLWMLSLLYFFLGTGFFGITFWLPQVVQRLSGLGDTGVGLVSAVPFVCAAAAMIAVSRRSDRTGLRRPWVVGGALVAASGFALTGWIADPLLALAALSLGAMGLWSVIGVFWQLPDAVLAGRAATVGVAIINACGSLGGFVGPYAVGLLVARTGHFGSALATIAGAMLATAATAALLRPDPAR